MVHNAKECVDAIYGFRTKTPEDIKKEVKWLLTKDRFTCPQPFALREVRQNSYKKTCGQSLRDQFSLAVTVLRPKSLSMWYTIPISKGDDNWEPKIVHSSRTLTLHSSALQRRCCTI